jgi:hypothetical protein
VKVRFTIDRVILDGMELSPLERLRLSDTLRTSLEAVVRERVSADGHAPLASRESERERVTMPLAAGVGGSGTGLGLALGPVVASSVWPGAPGTGGKR